MDFDEFLYKQELPENIRDCKNEILGTIVILNVIIAIVSCTVWCNGKTNAKRIEDLEQKNKTLKSIIFTAIEAGLLRMINHKDEDLHED